MWWATCVLDCLGKNAIDYGSSIYIVHSVSMWPFDDFINFDGPGETLRFNLVRSTCTLSFSVSWSGCGAHGRTIIV